MKKPLLSDWPVYRGWAAFQGFSKKVGVNPFVFMVPSLLALLTALADGVSIGLLIPTVHGLIFGSFAFVHHQPVLKHLVGMLPGSLARYNSAIFIFLIALIFFFSLTKNILLYASSLMTLYQVREFANKTRKMIYARYLSFGKMFFDRASAGHLHQILIGYTQQVSQELQSLQTSLYGVFCVVIYSGLALIISWKLTVFSLVVFPVLHFSSQTLIQKIRRSSEAFAKAYSEMGAKISNALSCITLVKAYSNETREKEWFNFTSDRVRDFQFNIDKKTTFFQPFQEVVGLCMILLMLGVMALLVVREKSGSLASFMVFFLVLRRASMSFGVFTKVQSSLASIRGPIQEIRSVLNDQGKFFVPEGNKVFTGLQNMIEFRNLSFGYVPGRQVLNRLHLTIMKNQTLAIVGASGSGKTTVISLLLRFYDVSPGTLFVDETDIREFTTASLHKKIALVSQDTFLLNASFRTNVTYGLGREVTDEELRNALDRARLLPLVKLIGLDVLIGDRGVKLSGGERQRLSIARAILKNPEILILDEATSALDSTTEGLIRAALAEIVRGKTVIVIAHRLATIRDSDQVVVLEKGRVVEEGAFTDLLGNTNGHFYSYWKNQKLDNEH